MWLSAISVAPAVEKTQLACTAPVAGGIVPEPPIDPATASNFKLLLLMMALPNACPNPLKLYVANEGPPAGAVAMVHAGAHPPKSLAPPPSTFKHWPSKLERSRAPCPQTSAPKAQKAADKEIKIRTRALLCLDGRFKAQLSCLSRIDPDTRNFCKMET